MTEKKDKSKGEKKRVIPGAKVGQKIKNQVLNVKFRVNFKLNLTRTKIIVLASLSFVALLLICFGIYSVASSKHVYGHVKIGSTDFHDKNKSEVRAEVEKLTVDFTNKELGLDYSEEKDKTYQISPAEITLNYDIDKTTDLIWSYGRNSVFWKEIIEQFNSIFGAREVSAVYTLNNESLDNKIGLIAEEIDNPEKDYSIYYQDEKFLLSEERQSGKRIDQKEIKNNILKRIGDLDSAKIDFVAKQYEPQIDPGKARAALKKANAILSLGDLLIYYGSQQFKMDIDTIGGVIQSKTSGNDLEIVINPDRMKVFVDSLSQSIDTEPKSATLKIVDGKAVIDQSANMGSTLDKTQSAEDIKNALFSRTLDEESNHISKVILKVDTKKPEISDTDLGSMGIVELIGIGSTNFVKSPTNRVHNINVGAKALNGALVKPGETFSTLKKLGAIDASSGYLEELVIKENRTVPEFGGGLCQVSSTLFRAVLNAGLKVTERQSHKYRVSYYEPPVGMDATIYDPAPDFKFQNNYSTYIYIQSKVVGTVITFEIYGTKDGRTVEMSTPELYDVVDPGPAVMVETDTLPAGEKKKIESAHQGASAKFNYKVTKNGETLQEKTFTSKYVPWPEKWLVGKGTTPAPSCTDAIQNGDETGIDCGGSCPNACPVTP